MNNPLISGGYVLLSRKLTESEIMRKPPEYLKVWIYLLSNATHTERGNLRRGQGFTSIPELQGMLSYYIGYRKEIPSKKKVWGILEWLRNPCEGNAKETTKEPMIVTVKVTHGIIYTICKYDIYQDSKSYESNNEGNNEGITKVLRRERQGNNINKNDKNDKNKEYINMLSVEENKFIDILSSIKNYPLDTEKDLEMYKALIERYPTLDLIEAIDDWKQYKIDKPLKENSNARSQINNSFRKYVEWGKCIKVTESSTRTYKDENPFLNRG